MSSIESRERTLLPAAVWLAPATMLLVALADLPYGFYTLLRVVVCAAAVLLVFHEYDLRGDASGWTVVLTGMVILFNPLFPVGLPREQWAPIDASCAIVLVIHYLVCRRLAATAPVTPTSASSPRPSGKPAGSPLERRRPVDGRSGVEALVHGESVRVASSEDPDARRRVRPSSRSARPASVRSDQDHDSTALRAGTRLQEYEIVRVLGAGGFGITYLAFDHRLHGPVAIKEYFYAGLAARDSGGAVAPGSTSKANEFEWGRARFLEEARLLARLDHPNIVRIRRCFEANKTAYIVMDYVEGASLAAVLEEHGRLTPAQWRPWMEALLDGLEHVHRLAYLHRDIKPANIVIRAEPTGTTSPVLIDFGSARRAAAERTRHLTAVHTPGYAPIEQYSSSSRQGPATDIYALAAVSYRVLAGEPPPGAADRMVKDDYRPLVARMQRPGDHFLAAIDRALAPLATDRPQSIAVWRAKLAGEKPGKASAPNAGDGCDSGITLARPPSPWPAATAAIGKLFAAAKQGDAPARARLQTEAEQGSTAAQNCLGLLHFRGQGVHEDAKQAVEWFQKAAEQGHAAAQNNLGVLYCRGDGVPADEARAAEWYRRGARAGLVEARLNLDRLRKQGIAGERGRAYVMTDGVQSSSPPAR